MTKDEITQKINAVAPLIITLVAGINTVLTLMGKPNIQIGDETITLVISGLATVIGEIWSWWFNNNFTKKAQLAQPVLNGLKDGSISEEEVEKLTEK